MISYDHRLKKRSYDIVIKYNNGYLELAGYAKRKKIDLVDIVTFLLRFFKWIK